MKLSSSDLRVHAHLGTCAALQHLTNCQAYQLRDSQRDQQAAQMGGLLKTTSRELRHSDDVCEPKVPLYLHFRRESRNETNMPQLIQCGK